MANYTSAHSGAKIDASIRFATLAALATAICNDDIAPAVGDVFGTDFSDTDRIPGTGFLYRVTSVTESAPLLADGATERTALATVNSCKYWGDPMFLWVELTSGGNVAKLENIEFSGAIKLTGHGQSNMTGFQPDDGPGYTTPPVDPNPSGRLWIWNMFTTAWEVWDQTSNPAQYGGKKADGPVAATVNNDCPMFHLGKQIVAKTGALTLVLMNARGGTDLYQWLPSTGANDLMWDDYADQVAESGLDRISHAFWLHGENHENDVVDGIYDYITEWEKWRTAMLARGEFDTTTPVTIGQIRDYWQASAVRLGGPDGVNGKWAPYIDGSLDPQIYVAGIKDLPSTTVATYDGDAHYSRAAIQEIGRDAFWATFCGSRDRALAQQAGTIALDTTLSVSTSGYYTDRINGYFDTISSALAWLQTKRIKPGVTVTIDIAAGTYTDDPVIYHPDATKDSLVIQGAALSGGAPTMTGTKATDIAALETYIPTIISGQTDVRSGCTINRVMFKAASSGDPVGIGVENGYSELRWVAVVDFTTGIQTLSACSWKAVSNCYAVHNATYGLRTDLGVCNFNGTTNIGLHNGTTDFYASLGGTNLTGTKAGATFNPARGAANISTTGGANY